MKHILSSLIIILFLAVSCRYEPVPMIGTSENPFLDKTVITGYDGSGTIRFSLITDVHFGRNNDGPVRRFDDNYFSFLKTKHYPFAVSLGDITDNGFITDEVIGFADTIKSLAGYFIECIGNHDMHNPSAKWNSGDPVFTKAAAYSFGDADGRPILSIYKLDTSENVIGAVQFAFLEEALKADDAEYKIIVTHSIVTSGGVADMSAVLLGLSIQERNRLYKLMDRYGVGLILSGHYHKGNIAYHMKSIMGEFNCAAYHQRYTKPFEYESEGYWYDVEISIESGVATITPYLAETSDAKTPFIFMLPKN